MIARHRAFGDLLKEHRQAAGVSQEALAERARLSVQTISALERGVRKRPYRDTVALLAGALSLSPDARAELERAAARRDFRVGTAALPSGVTAFLFTNVDGGLSRWESRPDAMAAAVARHDELVRSAIETHGGSIFRITGEEFCAAFARIEDATAAALDAQRALASEDFSAVDGLQAQMALHTGQADVRHGDYIGPASSRVSRLLEVAHGGQILVSAAATDLLRDNLPVGVSLHGLGPHRLRDLTWPEDVFQLSAPGTDALFPSLRSLELLPNNLPTQLSSFIGRENDVAEVEQLIVRHRLVTLVGAGGIGKTRIALHVAAEMLDGSGQGVWFVDFAPLTDASLVPNAIASTLGELQLPNRPLLETLIAYLKTKHLLLVIDNCEHLIDDVARVADAILQHCPRVHILATSREPLKISGERVYRVPSLGTPLANTLRTLSVDEALGYGAVALFIDRASAVDSRFTLTEQLIPLVAEICGLLDGLPLAIELAAARLNVLSAATLTRELRERFGVLTSGSRTALPRHKTMRALLDWSYALLSSKEQLFFRYLSIFIGGFTLELAMALCAGDDAIVKDEVLDLLASLVDKSLVQTETAADTTRYRLLEGTRQYALEQLREAREYTAAAHAHAAAVLALAERLNSALEAMPDRLWNAQVKPELDNWRAGLTWSLGPNGDLNIGQRLAASVSTETWLSLAPGEAQGWVRTAIQRCDNTTPLQVRAHLELADASTSLLLTQSANATSLAAAERALRDQQPDDPLGIAEAQLHVGFGLIQYRRFNEGEHHVSGALVLARAHGAQKLIPTALRALGLARSLDGDLDAARSFYREALTLHKAAGCERLAAKEAFHLAEVEFEMGAIDTALQLGRDAIQGHNANHCWVHLMRALTNCSAYLIALTRYDEARSTALEALTLARDAGLTPVIAFTLQHLAAISALRADNSNADRIRSAAGVLGFVNARLASRDVPRQYTEQQEYDRMLTALHGQLGAALDKHMNDGQQWSEDQAVEIAVMI